MACSAVTGCSKTRSLPRRRSAVCGSTASFLKGSGLERVTFKKTDWSEHLDPSALGLIRDVELQRVILKDCRFEDCRFDGTRLEGFDASNLTFKNVDFTNLVIKTAEDFARLGARNVA